MTRYNPQIHHRKSIRLRGYDYSQAGLYFITMVTHNRESLFGEITNQKMILNDGGKVAKQCWIDISKHFPHAFLHEFVVMPNHVHGIIELDDTAWQGTDDGCDIVRSKKFSTLHFSPIQPPNVQPFRSPSRTIGSIVRGFKIGVTKWFRNSHPQDFPTERPIWHRNYYEHIIRDHKSYLNVSEYIATNPERWQEDRFWR